MIGGIITYEIIHSECEIITLNSFVQNSGIGTKLLKRVINEASSRKSTRVWLITTNDNTHALRFYQKRGFNLKAIHLNAVDFSRKLKLEIPLIGDDGIPIKHEIELEIRV